jgi:uncharacterized protein (TIGR02217 family)
MSVEVLADIVLSNQVLSAGVRGRQVRRNQRVAFASGYQSINIAQAQTLREFDLGTVPLRRTDWQEIEALFEITEGGAYGFLLMDPKDSSVSSAEGKVAGPITGAASTFQLFKRYTESVSGRIKDRKITRPNAVQIYVDGSPVASSPDPATGRVEVSGGSGVDPTRITWSGSFYVPVHFLNDQIDWQLDIAGPTPDARFLSGPMVTVREILEGLPVA